MISCGEVDDIYRNCSTNAADHVSYKGLVMHTFNTEMLDKSKDRIRTLLQYLSFPNMWMNLCMDRNDNQWGEQRDVEKLIALGVASGILVEIARNPNNLTLRAFDMQN